MKKITTIYIDQEDLGKLKEISQKEDGSVCQIIRKLIKEYLENKKDLTK